MAKQTGFLKVEGTIGDVTFMKTQDGYRVRQKGGVPASRIATDPNFKRTRENMAEFGAAGKAGKVLRKAFNPERLRVKDGRLVSRLVKSMMGVIRSDVTHRRGERTVTGGNLALLQGFEFNGSAQLSTNLAVPYASTIDRANGELSVTLPAFIPENKVVPPISATHFRILSAGGWVDFTTGEFEVVQSESQAYTLDETPTEALQLKNQVTPASTKPLFLLLGLEFLQELNGFQYPLQSGSFNSMAVVLVDQDV